MAKIYKVGMAEMVHDHVWDQLRHWKSLPNVQMVAASDVNEPLRERAKKDAGVARTYVSWREMLEKEELDIVQLGSANNAKAEIVEACASKGIHVETEKPMAANLEQAERMLKAAEKGGIKLIVNWPTAWVPSYAEWFRRVSAGDIGEVTYLRYRSAHNGPHEIGCSPYFSEWVCDAEKSGAGVFMDYTCYTADFAACLFGMPTSVTGMRGTFMKDYPVPDDNGILVIKYPHTFVLSEASWTQTTKYAGSGNPVAYGQTGSIAVDGDKVLLYRPKQDVEVITPPALVAPMRNAPDYLIHCIENDLPIEGLCSPIVCRDAQAIIAAGLKAADTGQTVNF
jgi:predicted dehydrogenase